MTLLVALVVLGGGLGSGNEPSPCAADADCMISTFPGCCGSCCKVQPYAVSVAVDKGRRKVCDVASCAGPQCGKVKCDKPEPASAFRAVCENQVCTAVRK